MIGRLVSTAVFLCLLVSTAGAGTITGMVFTAEHEDSLARGVPLSLVYRGPADQLQRIDSTTDSLGHFHFFDLSADTSIGYVLRIEIGGRELLSSPMRFEPGEDLIVSNFVLPSSGERPRLGEPVEQNPLHAVVVVLSVLLVFVGLAILARRRQEGKPEAQVPAGARALVRDIASLDERYGDGVIGEEEYRKVRERLVARLRSLNRKRPGS